MSMISVEADNVSTGWLAIARRLDNEPKRKAIHTMTRIANPVSDHPLVRSAMDEVLAAGNKQSVETVANTIFPEAIARTSVDHDTLVDRYVRMYPTLKKRFHKNGQGTYFGRLIQYRAPKGRSTRSAQ